MKMSTEVRDFLFILFIGGIILMVAALVWPFA